MSVEIKRWRAVDLTNKPPYLISDDVCHYFMDYQAKGGHSASNSNSLINNFKKDSRFRGQAPWHYKLAAVRSFAKDLIELFGNTQTLTIAFIPGSKRKGDPSYDERFDLLKRELSLLNPNFKFEEPIEIKESREATHSSNKRLKPSEIMETYRWLGFSGAPPDYLILIDDVVTTGAQFRAYSDTVKQNCSNTVVYGVFWGKSFWITDFNLLRF